MKTEIDLKDIASMLKKRALLIIGIIVLALVTSFIYSKKITTPLYQSATQLLVFDSNTNAEAIDDSTGTSSTPDVSQIQANLQLINTYIVLIKSDLVLDTVAHDLQDKLSSNQLKGKIIASQQPNSQIINITVTDIDAARAANIANITANVFKEKAKETMRFNNIVVIADAKVNTSPIKPNLILNLELALVAGLLLGILIALLLGYFDNTIKLEKDLNNIPIPIYGSIPTFINKGRKKQFIPYLNLDSPIFENYRTIRTNIQFSQGEMKTLLVTSAEEGQGKTTTAINLGVVFAQQSIKTLIIDADMRKPTVHQKLSMKNTTGLSLILAGKTKLKNCIQKTNIENLNVITSGAIPPNPAELLSSKAMVELLETLKADYEMIIIDSPPVHHVTDASILSKISNGVLLVVRQGAQKDPIQKTQQTLLNINAKILGIVFNDKKLKNKEKYYYYKKK